MKFLRTLYHLARADFLERVRRSSFLVLAGFTVYMGYLFVPPAGANYQTVSLGDARGIYNSPWVGTMFGIMISTLMTLVAFFPIKNAVTRDRQTRVGQIVATTPMRKPVYLLGKWLSNVAVLALLMLIMTLMALVMQWVRAEDLHVDVWALVLPIWLIGFPALTVVAALAVLFECIPFLQGGLGNIVYFFLYMTILIISIEGTTDANGLLRPSNDLFGISHPIADMQRVIMHYDPDYKGALIIGGAELSESPLRFPWEGIVWTFDLVMQRLSWIALAILITLGAVLPFDRFDPARQRIPHKRKRHKDRVSDEQIANDLSSNASSVSPYVTLTPLPNCRSHWRFGTVLQAELRLMLKGQPWWWYAVAGGLIIASAVMPLEVAATVLAFAWLWPILVWSPMG
ncbi:MAG: ABC transporter permease, partial [Anaerolineae bacterium]